MNLDTYQAAGDALTQDYGVTLMICAVVFVLVVGDACVRRRLGWASLLVPVLTLLAVVFPWAVATLVGVMLLLASLLPVSCDATGRPRPAGPAPSAPPLGPPRSRTA